MRKTTDARGRGTVQGLPDWDRCAVIGRRQRPPPIPSPTAGRFFDTALAVKHGMELVAQGADLVDVGGESTRPGARQGRRGRGAAARPARRAGPWPPRASPSSVDTMRARASRRRAVEAGAVLVNDVSGGLADPAMVPVGRGGGPVPFVVMQLAGLQRGHETAAPCTRTVAGEGRHRTARPGWTRW